MLFLFRGILILYNIPGDCKFVNVTFKQVNVYDIYIKSTLYNPTN